MLSLDRHTHTIKKHKVNLKFHSNSKAALVATTQSALSLPNYPSRKDTTIMQTSWLTHRMDLKLIGISGGVIAE